MKRGLSVHGIEVIAFSDPERALTDYKPNYYDEVILDVRMDKMNGFELARRIWKQDPQANVCFLTAFEIYTSEAETVFPSMKTFCFLKKPILPSVLVEHITSHFNESK